MAENRRGRENRFYFSRAQMVLLGGAFALASVVIFGLGMYVGKSIEETKLVKKEEPLIKIPVNPANQRADGARTAQPKDEVLFDPVSTKAQSSLPLEGEKPAEIGPGEKAAVVEPKDTKRKTKNETSAAKLALKRSEKSLQTDGEPKKADAEESTEGKDPGKVWRAQVNAYPDERSAKLLVERLKNKGYNAYVNEVQYKGKPWYRVSIGKFGTREEAEKVVDVLKSRENHPTAFAASR
jgi:septal ring-binding cell division protein DamX